MSEYRGLSEDEFIASLSEEEILRAYDLLPLVSAEPEKYIGEHMGLEVLPEPFIVDGMTIGYPFNLEHAIKKFGKGFMPDCLGIYHLFFESQLVYVGMSTNIRARLLSHLKDKDKVFTHVLWFPASMMKSGATIKDVLTLEAKMIRKFKPVLNMTYTFRK